MSSADWGTLIPAIVALITAIVGIIGNRRNTAAHGVNASNIAATQAKLNSHIQASDSHAVPPQR